MEETLTQWRKNLKPGDRIDVYWSPEWYHSEVLLCGQRRAFDHQMQLCQVCSTGFEGDVFLVQVHFFGFKKTHRRFVDPTDANGFPVFPEHTLTLPRPKKARKPKAPPPPPTPKEMIDMPVEEKEMRTNKFGRAVVATTVTAKPPTKRNAAAAALGSPEQPTDSDLNDWFCSGCMAFEVCQHRVQFTSKSLTPCYSRSVRMRRKMTSSCHAMGRACGHFTCLVWESMPLQRMTSGFVTTVRMKSINVFYVETLTPTMRMGVWSSALWLGVASSFIAAASIAWGMGISSNSVRQRTNSFAGTTPVQCAMKRKALSTSATRVREASMSTVFLLAQNFMSTASYVMTASKLVMSSHLWIPSISE